MILRVASISDELSELGVRVVLLDTPDHPSMLQRLSDTPEGDNYRLFRRTLTQVAGKLDLPLLRYRTEDLGAADPDELFNDGVHLNDRGAALLTLDRVAAADADALGEVGQGADVLEWALDRATAGLCAELLGTASRAFELTLEHLRSRQQFDVPIGSFQALKHRAAEWFCEVELTRSITLRALRAIDEESADLARLASAAKARASDVFIHSGEEGVQLHGGIGMTNDIPIGHYFKRLSAIGRLNGDSDWQRNRFAGLNGVS